MRSIEARDVIFSVVMVFSTFVLAYRLYGRYRDTAIALSAVIIVGMLALLFLSIDERLRRIEETMIEHERSLRVSLQSVENEVRDKVSTSTRRFEEIREEMQRRGFR